MRRGRLARKYMAVLVTLVAGILVASGAIELRSSYVENEAALVALQREKAHGAAARIEAFIHEIELQLVWTTQPPLGGPAAALAQRRLDGVRLQRQLPPVTELSYLDAAGREQLRVSRLTMDLIGGQTDYSAEPKFLEARKGRTWFGPVYFRKESEPYMTIALPQVGGGVTVAEVNLKFIWDVVSQMKVGTSGLAYAVDGGGALIAHPDISLVLQKTSLAGLPQVKAALAPAPGTGEITIARDVAGREVLTAHSRIPSLGWVVFVEQPLGEAFAPVRASAWRIVFLVAFGIAFSIVASVVLGRRLARPIQALQHGAAKIGAGELDHRIDLRTGDELEALADEFNRMTGRLAESYATLEQKVEDRTRELSESLEQQTATSEILGIISSSPTNVQPVLDAVAMNAVRVCGGEDALILLVEGDVLRRVAHTGELPLIPGGDTLRRPLTARSVAGLAILERRTLHIPDLEADLARGDWPDSPRHPGAGGFRTVLMTPLLREDTAIGAIFVRRKEVRPFTDKQIVLLQTFADQAVIAIENVRLFKELQARNAALSEALDQQTATAEILRAISGSPTDVQPVFEAIVESAARLCEAQNAQIFRAEEARMRLVARYGPVRSSLEAGEARPITRGSVSGRTILDRASIHAVDLLAEVDTEYPDIAPAIRREGIHTTVGVPLLREGQPIGSITAFRTETRPFTDKQIALLQTFADQAVIAIENVRLFTELQARTADLTRSVGELEALGEVGRAISSTLDFERVLDTIVSRANDLAGTDGGAIYEYEEASDRFHLRATHNFSEDFVALLRATPLEPGEGAVGQAGTLREPVQIADIADASGYASRVRDALVSGGYRALLAVPLLSEDQVVGALVVNRRAPGEFDARTVELLRTFATQSALAIQNARLFREIEDKGRQLEAANRHKDEFLASMSHELRTPLNAVIGFSEVLLERMFGEVNPKQEEYLNDILASGRHLLSLINDILDLAKIEAGRMELDLEEFDLPQAIDNALVLIRERATRKGLSLDVRLAGDLGGVRGDQRKIKQVLLNLLSNAVKFTPEGGRIEVRGQRGDSQAEISVADTGIGIAADDLEAVFEEFRQVGTDYTKKHEGTGLGLTLSRKFVELHGGRLWVKSQPGQGSTFTFTIPVTAWPTS